MLKTQLFVHFLALFGAPRLTNLPRQLGHFFDQSPKKRGHKVLQKLTPNAPFRGRKRPMVCDLAVRFRVALFSTFFEKLLAGSAKKVAPKRQKSICFERPPGPRRRDSSFKGRMLNFGRTAGWPGRRRRARAPSLLRPSGHGGARKELPPPCTASRSHSNAQSPCGARKLRCFPVVSLFLFLLPPDHLCSAAD